MFGNRNNNLKQWGLVNNNAVFIRLLLLTNHKRFDLLSDFKELFPLFTKISKNLNRKCDRLRNSYLPASLSLPSPGDNRCSEPLLFSGNLKADKHQTCSYYILLSDIFLNICSFQFFPVTSPTQNV